jgi:NAD(P)-dependent dehydrogenase (short-subunit alcohol dehydrogenase family)
MMLKDKVAVIYGAGGVGRLRSGDGRGGGTHSSAIRRAAPRGSRQGIGTDLGAVPESLASNTHTRRLMTLQEVPNVAVFTASDKASGLTGTTVNLTMGSLDD